MVRSSSKRNGSGFSCCTLMHNYRVRNVLFAWCFCHGECLWGSCCLTGAVQEVCAARGRAGQAFRKGCVRRDSAKCVSLCCSIWCHKGHGINSWRVAAAWETIVVCSASGRQSEQHV